MQNINGKLIKLIYLNFHPLEVASHYHDPQLQVGENYLNLINLQSTFANPTHFVSNISLI